MSRKTAASAATQYLDDEFSWRHKEIIDLKLAIRAAQGAWEDTLLRAGVPLLYAHWEGFIKKAAEALLEFVANQRLMHKELKPCFWVLGVKRHLNQLDLSGKTKDNIEALDKILRSGDLVSRFSAKGNVDTESNLSSVVFERIVHLVGLDYAPYSGKEYLIDKSLLDARNHIAHGQALSISKQRFTSLSDEIVGIMRLFKNDLENMIVLGAYKV